MNQVNQHIKLNDAEIWLMKKVERNLISWLTKKIYWWSHLQKKVNCQRKSIAKESCLTKKIDWQKKLIDKKSLLTKKVDWQKKLIDKKSWLSKKVNWRRKLIDEESRLTNLGFDDIHILHMHRWTTSC